MPRTASRLLYVPAALAEPIPTDRLHQQKAGRLLVRQVIDETGLREIEAVNVERLRLLRRACSVLTRDCVSDMCRRVKVRHGHLFHGVRGSHIAVVP